MEIVDLKIEFDIIGDNPGAIYELAERVREVLAEAIETRWVRADGIEIEDFDIITDE
jgi:hypothetical protein